MDNHLLNNLNKEQNSAVTHGEGPVLIVAGAGTGKTTVITRRIAYLVNEGLARSDEILALTFTEKAAGEMEERVDKLLPLGYFDLWISTFHGFGERILKDHGLEIGLPGGFKLLNEFEQWALIQKNLDKFNLDYYRPLGNPTKFIHALIKHFSRLKDEDVAPADYLAYAEGLKANLDGMLSDGVKNSKSKISISKQITNHKSQIINTKEINKNGAEAEQQEIMRINEIANAYHVYQQLLLDNNALDFGDLINYTLKLFRERPAILEKYRHQFKYILLDEFQDTNWAQYELVKLMAAPRNDLMVVGDDDQSVYKFRGASVSNIMQFKKDYPDSKEVFLINNYRSVQNILDLSYNFIQLNNPNRLEWQLAHPEAGGKNRKKSGMSKKLIAAAESAGTIEVVKGADLADEMAKAASKIAELKAADKECTWNDFGILVRANDSAKDMCACLDQAGLPYQYFASRGLYAKPVIMDIVAYLKLLDSYHESIALYRILNLPFFNFTHKELVDFNYVARKKAWSLFSVLKEANGKFGPETQEKINRVLRLIEKHASLSRSKTVLEIILSFMEDSGYLEYLTKLDERESREQIGYLNGFVKRVQAFESASDDKSVKVFLTEFNLELEAGEQGALGFDPDSGPEAIKVMTVHGAKGLEFKYVFIINMVDKRFPTIERGEPISVPDALVKETLPVGDVHLEEERRLFYVAMTRAKQGLYFTWSEDYGGTRKKKPSRFLVEAKLLNTEQVEAEIINPKSKIINSRQPENTGPAEKINNARQVLPNYFSYSQIAAFSNCPHQYYFAHILKIPMHGKAVFSFGKTMHSSMQKIFMLAEEKRGLGQANLFGNNNPVETRHGASPDGASLQTAPNISSRELKEIFEECWIDEWYESKEQKEQYRKLGPKILEGFLEKHKENWPNAVNLEKGFNFKIRDGHDIYTIRGTIDRIDETPEGIKIVDYKTGAAKEKLGFDEKEQLLIYQLAILEQNHFNKPVASLAFYYLEKNVEIEFSAKDEELEKMKEKIIATIKDIRGGEFPPKPSILCNYCDFKDICEHRK